VLISIIVFAIFMRLDRIDSVYTEYDDIGVIALQKGFVGDNSLKINLGPFKSVEIYNDFLKDIETNLFYGLYIAKAWTYAPGQYFFASLFINQTDTAINRHQKVRYISSVFSIFALLIMAFFVKTFHRDEQSYWNFIVWISLIAFSSNAIAYAAHASPYSAYVCSIVFSLSIIGSWGFQKIKFLNCLILLNLMFIFNYLVLMITIPFIILAWINFIFRNKKLISEINYKTTISFSFSFLPILIFIPFVRSSAPRGIMPTQFSDFSLIDFLGYFINQSLTVSESIFFGALEQTPASFIFIMIIIISPFFCMHWFKKKYYVPIISLIFIFEWLVLHFLQKLPFDQTRHSLVLLPALIFIGFYLFQTFINRVPKNLLRCVGAFVAIIFIHNGFENSNNLKNEKTTSKLSKDLILDQSPDVIITFGSSLSPLVYFYENNNIEVYYFDISSIKKVEWQNYTNDTKFILVSQDQGLDELMEISMRQKMPELFYKRCMKTILEYSNGIYFPYNSYKANSGQNGAFIYEVSVNACG
jgi:hypothetical protein